MKIVHLAGEFPRKIDRGLAPLFHRLPYWEKKAGHRVWFFALSRQLHGWQKIDGLDVYFAPKPRGSRWRAGLVLLEAIRHQKIEPDIIHSFNPLPLGWLFGWGRKKIPRARFVLGLHTWLDPHKYHYLKGLKASLQAYELSVLIVHVARRVDQVIAISLFQKRSLIQKGVKAGKITVIPTAIDLENFNFKPKTALGAKTNLLYVGRLAQVKNIPWLIDSLAALKNFELSLVGGTPQDNDWHIVNQKIRQLRLQKKVKIVPPVPNSQLASFYHRADATIIPSKVEGLNKTALESMAAGTPVIASDTPGLRETVLPGKTGLTFPVNDAEKLREQIRALLANPSLRSKLPSNGLAIAENHSLEIMARRYLALFKRLT